jgi:hypothetical protein
MGGSSLRSCLAFPAFIEYVLEDPGRNFDAHINIILSLLFLHVLFVIINDILQVTCFRFMVDSLFVRPAVRSILTTLCSAWMMLIGSGPYANFSGSLSFLGLCSAPLLSSSLCSGRRLSFLFVYELSVIVIVFHNLTKSSKPSR